MSSRDEEFVAFAEASLRDLRRTAYLLCGDWGHAEDAVQTGLIKVYLRWSRLRREDSIWGYTRRAVVTSLIDDSRRAWRTRETYLPECPDTPIGDGTGSVDDRLLLRQAMAALPSRQRAVVILRYLDDLDVAETAFVLRCPAGR